MRASRQSASSERPHVARFHEDINKLQARYRRRSYILLLLSLNGSRFNIHNLSAARYTDFFSNRRMKLRSHFTILRGYYQTLSLVYQLVPFMHHILCIFQPVPVWFRTQFLRRIFVNEIIMSRGSSCSICRFLPSVYLRQD